MSRDKRPARSEFASEVGFSGGGAGFDATDEESVRLGCPMLSRVRLQGRQRGAIATMRCALGYALRTRDDAGRCMQVEGPNSCWKVAPSWRVAAPAEPETSEPAVAEVGVEVEVEVEVAVTVVEVDVILSELPVNGAAENGEDALAAGVTARPCPDPSK